MSMEKHTVSDGMVENLKGMAKIVRPPNAVVTGIVTGIKLFDENLSPKLARRLADLFPNSTHVRDVGLKSSDDPLVWEYAKQNNLMIGKREK